MLESMLKYKLALGKVVKQVRSDFFSQCFPLFCISFLIKEVRRASVKRLTRYFFFLWDNVLLQHRWICILKESCGWEQCLTQKNVSIMEEI